MTKAMENDHRGMASPTVEQREASLSQATDSVKPSAESSKGGEVGISSLTYTCEMYDEKSAPCYMLWKNGGTETKDVVAEVRSLEAAQLFAAAPELLEAARRTIAPFIRSHGGRNIYDRYSEKGCVAPAARAIEKATGKTIEELWEAGWFND